MVLEGGAGSVWAVAFHPDGMHFFDGTSEGIRRWRVADGQELGKQTEMDLNAISVSIDQKWVVCGTMKGASVWDAELRKKVVEVEGTRSLYSVDVQVASNGTRFATGTTEGQASIWSITTGERLVGPLEHGGIVRGVKFSPDGGRIATLDGGVIRIFDSHNGDELISIENPMDALSPLTPIAWSMDSERLFATSLDSKIKSFDSSTGSQLAEWNIHENDDSQRMSIALAANNKFIASSAGPFVSFWDTLTQDQVGIVKDTQRIRCVALSPDSSRLVTGSDDSGEVIIWDLRGILPESYLPINVSTRSPHLENTIYSSIFFRPCNFLVRPQNVSSRRFQSSTVISLNIFIVVFRPTIRVQRGRAAKTMMRLSSRCKSIWLFPRDTALTVVTDGLATNRIGSGPIIRLRGGGR